MINLVNELQKACDGDSWHGNNVVRILSAVDTSKVFAHPIPEAHSIAELVLHMTAWTEEVCSRLEGNVAREPYRGDWPLPKVQNEKDWQSVVADFKQANGKLIQLASAISDKHWDDAIKDERNPALGAGVSNAELLNGLIQHHAYHAGQISLLLKF